MDKMVTPLTLAEAAKNLKANAHLLRGAATSVTKPIAARDFDEAKIRSVDETLREYRRNEQAAKYRAYRQGFQRGRNWQHKCEQKDRAWNYIGVATIAGVIGVWAGIVLSNGI